MDCNVIRDLLPLYVDDCCTEQSSNVVQEHLESCKSCQRIYSAMKTPTQITAQAQNPVIKMHRIKDWKASVLQSLQLFVSFFLISLGVLLEAATPQGFSNGVWAFALVIPATANLFSIVNWYFVRLYRNKKVFSNCSCLFTLLLLVGGYGWGLLHYEFAIMICAPVVLGIALSVFFIVMSKILSNWYAQLLGKV